jgi:hypothetical protein
LHLPVYVGTSRSQAEFIEFWGNQYDYPGENFYTKNIGKRLTAESIKDLFVWKNGMRLSSKKDQSVQHYIDLLPRIRQLPHSTDPATFLKKVLASDAGGAIWGIFLLHCWSAAKYPIYDQHVHRAMNFIRGEKREEIGGIGPVRLTRT